FLFEYKILTVIFLYNISCSIYYHDDTCKSVRQFIHCLAQDINKFFLPKFQSRLAISSTTTEAVG
ncbi:unnamed protein product, partial [Musa banksii]